jgi:hypothetical protein
MSNSNSDMKAIFELSQNKSSYFSAVYRLSYIILGCVVVSVLAIGPKDRWFKWIFKSDKNRFSTSFVGVVKPSAPCRKILLHVKDPCGVRHR